MSDINLSSAVRSSLISLQGTADLLSSTQERLATGNRVNSALDDPTAFFTASSLNNRANDLSTLLDAQQQAIRTVEAADQGITAIEDLVDSARAQATAALQTDDASVRATAAAAFDDILGQIESLAQDASFNGTNLLEGDDLQVIFNEGGSSSLTVEGFNFSDASTLGLNRQSPTINGTTSFAASDLAQNETLTINSGAEGASDIAVALEVPAVEASDASVTTSGFAVGDLEDGDTISITGTNGSGAESTITLTFGTGVGEIDLNPGGSALDQAGLVTAINSALGTEFGNDGESTPTNNVVATDASGEIAFASTTGNVSFTFTDANDATGNVTATSTDFAVEAEARRLTDAELVDAINTATANTGDSAVTASLADGNIVLTSANGNVTATDGAADGAENAVSATSSTFVQGGNSFATDADINSTLSSIDSALSTLRSSAASLGSDLSTIQIRQDFTSNLINTLEAGAGDLTLADLNEEGANLLTLQTRQQLASTSLSFATQSQSSVLSLF